MYLPAHSSIAVANAARIPNGFHGPQRAIQCRFVPVWGDRCLVGGDPPHAILLSRGRVESFIDDEHLIFLGLYQDHPTFAFSIDQEQPPPFAELGEFHDLRFLGTALSTG